jgi:hypothetical protein
MGEDTPVRVEDHRIGNAILAWTGRSAAAAEELDQLEERVVVLAQDRVDALLGEVTCGKETSIPELAIEESVLVEEHVTHDHQDNEGDEAEDPGGDRQRQ